MDPLPTSLFKFFAPTLIASRGADNVPRIEGIASSTTRDHHGDTITPKALQKMADTAVGLTVFMNHEYRVPGDVFGKITKAVVVKTGERDAKSNEPIWDLRVGIGVASGNEDAVKTFGLIESGQAQLGLSIGAMVPEGGSTFSKEAGGRYIFDDIELVETSVVGVPAHPRAMVDYAVKSIAGKFPNNLVKERKTLLEQMALEEGGEAALAILKSGDSEVETLDDPLAKSAEGIGTEMVGLEVKEGETAELTVHADGTSEAKIIAKADEAEGFLSASGEPVDLAEPEFDITNLVHPDIALAGQTGDHTHGHAHDHEHEHTHNAGSSNETVHTHDHAHLHSHEHDGKHPHADGKDDYQHNHDHTGASSWENNEDHPHEGVTKKALVTVWETEDGTTAQVDTGRTAPEADDGSHSAQVTPDIAGGQVTDSADGAITAMALATATLDGSSSILKALVGQNAALRADNLALRGERKVAIEVAGTAIKGIGELLVKIGNLPMGRRAGYSAVLADFDALKDIYSDDVRKLLT